MDRLSLFSDALHSLSASNRFASSLVLFLASYSIDTTYIQTNIHTYIGHHRAYCSHSLLRLLIFHCDLDGREDLVLDMAHIDMIHCAFVVCCYLEEA
jgi:hypothetical protein